MHAHYDVTQLTFRPNAAGTDVWPPMPAPLSPPR